MNRITKRNKLKCEYLMSWLSSSSSNGDESKAAAASNQLPVWETVIGMLPNEECNERRASVSLTAGTCHSGCYESLVY
jgi:hypothetical protein